jgi:polysaccharide biosynthesis/export protein
VTSNQKIAVALRRPETLAFLCACFALTACTDVPKLPPGVDAPALQTSYLIQPGDTLDVKFVKNPELNEQPTVQPDGRISMLYAPGLEVAGRSTEDARQALTEVYAKQLKEPGISVAVKGPVTWHVFVGGEVKNPGQLDGTGPLPTLTQAIDRAGGMLDSGDQHKVVLARRAPDNLRKAYLVDFYKAAHGENPAGDVQLAAYDALFVPRTGIADVYSAYNQYFKQFLPNNFGISYRVGGGS